MAQIACAALAEPGLALPGEPMETATLPSQLSTHPLTQQAQLRGGSSAFRLLLLQLEQQHERELATLQAQRDALEKRLETMGVPAVTETVEESELFASRSWLKHFPERQPSSQDSPVTVGADDVVVEAATVSPTDDGRPEENFEDVSLRDLAPTPLPDESDSVLAVPPMVAETALTTSEADVSVAYTQVGDRCGSDEHPLGISEASARTSIAADCQQLGAAPETAASSSDAKDLPLPASRLALSERGVFDEDASRNMGEEAHGSAAAGAVVWLPRTNLAASPGAASMAAAMPNGGADGRAQLQLRSPAQVSPALIPAPSPVLTPTPTPVSRSPGSLPRGLLVGMLTPHQVRPAQVAESQVPQPFAFGAPTVSIGTPQSRGASADVRAAPGPLLTHAAVPPRASFTWSPVPASRMGAPSRSAELIATACSNGFLSAISARSAAPRLSPRPINSPHSGMSPPRWTPPEAVRVDGPQLTFQAPRPDTPPASSDTLQKSSSATALGVAKSAEVGSGAGAVASEPCLEGVMERISVRRPSASRSRAAGIPAPEGSGR